MQNSTVYKQARYKQKPKHTVYMYGKADNTPIEKELADFKEQYPKEGNVKPVNENWEHFKKKLASIIDKNVPKRWWEQKEAYCT